MADDNLDGLLQGLALSKAGWHRVASPDGAPSFFPVTAKDTQEWEQRCVEMTAAQEVEVPEPKEPDTTRLVRA